MQRTPRIQQQQYSAKLAALRARRWAADVGDEASRAAGLYASTSSGPAANEVASPAAHLDETAFVQLTGRFGLDPVQAAIVLLLQIPDASGISLEDAANVIEEPPLRVYEALRAERALAFWNLVEVQSADRFTAHRLVLEETCQYWLAGGQQLDAALAGALTWTEPPPDSVGAAAQTNEPLVYLLHGADRQRNERSAAALAARAGRPLLRWAIPASFDESGGRDDGDRYLRSLIRIVGRETLWRDAALLVEDESVQQLGGNAAGYLYHSFAQLPVFIVSASVRRASLKRRFGYAIELEIQTLTFEDRLQYWQSNLPADMDHEELAQHGGTEEEITLALASAGMAAELRSAEFPNREELTRALQSQRNEALAELAQRIPPFYARENLIVPPAINEKLNDIAARYRQRGDVYRSWKFGGEATSGKGVNALFVGPPGTGKTMAANILAGELGLELYRVDLSRVVNKYIGETEKNLSRIFEAARQASALLFFDEADALFGKRTDVKDSHDRYANQETSHLLQLVEDYEGISILASNYETNMDEAFRRRLHQIVRFDWLDYHDRLKLWKSLFPAQAPIGEDVDFEYLAEKIRDFPPAFVKNIIISAAFYARRFGTPIDMRQIFRAIKREFEKEGKFFYPEQFSQYYELASSV